MGLKNNLVRLKSIVVIKVLIFSQYFSIFNHHFKFKCPQTSVNV